MSGSRKSPLVWDVRDYSRVARAYVGISAHTEGPYDQEHFRSRFDNGSISTATWIANTDVDIDVGSGGDIGLDTNFRVRFSVANLGDAFSGSRTAKLQYRLNAGAGFGAWTDVTTSSSVVQITASPNEADNAATTEVLGGTGTFYPASSNPSTFSRFDENSGGITGAIAPGTFGEAEFCVQFLSADLANGDVVELRTFGSTATNAYTRTPSFTIADVAAITFAPTVTAQGTATVSMAVGRSLNPTATGQATTAATLSLNSMVAATVTGVGTATADIVAVSGGGEQHELSPTAAGVGTTTVSMSVVREVSAAADGVGTAAVSTTVVAHRNASAAGVADASVSMSAVRELGDVEAVGAGTASVSLSVASQLSAAVDGVGQASAEPAVVRALDTEATGQGATTVTIVVSGSVELVASPEGEATATATVHVVRSVGADVVGAATVEVTVAPLRIRDATAAGEATVSVSVNVVRAFAAAPLGEGSAAVSSAAIRELVATATAAGVVSIVLTAVEAVVTPVSGKYARSHARAHQLLVGGNRVALTFTRTAQGAYDPEADSATVTVTTIVGVAVRRKGNPDRYKALGLVESNAPTLFFVPDTYGETPAPGDVTEWASEEYTVRDVERVAPDGVTIGAFIIIEK